MVQAFFWNYWKNLASVCWKTVATTWNQNRLSLTAFLRQRSDAVLTRSEQTLTTDSSPSPLFIEFRLLEHDKEVLWWTWFASMFPVYVLSSKALYQWLLASISQPNTPKFITLHARSFCIIILSFCHPYSAHSINTRLSWCNSRRKTKSFKFYKWKPFRVIHGFSKHNVSKVSQCEPAMNKKKQLFKIHRINNKESIQVQFLL